MTKKKINLVNLVVIYKANKVTIVTGIDSNDLIQIMSQETIRASRASI